jgi:hypothetical protein
MWISSMNSEHEIDGSAPLFAMGEERANGFSIVADGRRNITLLKRGKLVAWFSAMLDEKVIKVFIELVKTCESQTNGG